MKLYYNKLQYRNSAFTLSEVLIVLLIIGIIASITIPTIINNTNNAELVVKTKETYGFLNQAYMQIKAENNGDMDTATGSTHDSLMQTFASKLNVIRICQPYQNAGIC